MQNDTLKVDFGPTGTPLRDSRARAGRYSVWLHEIYTGGEAGEGGGGEGEGEGDGFEVKSNNPNLKGGEQLFPHSKISPKIIKNCRKLCKTS